MVGFDVFPIEIVPQNRGELLVFRGAFLTTKTKVSEHRFLPRKFQVKFRDMLTLEPEDCCEAWRKVSLLQRP